jgi:hypothetical protein
MMTINYIEMFEQYDDLQLLTYDRIRKRLLSVF